jgi:hypothetical protein
MLGVRARFRATFRIRVGVRESFTDACAYSCSAFICCCFFTSSRLAALALGLVSLVQALQSHVFLWHSR